MANLTVLTNRYFTIVTKFNSSNMSFEFERHEKKTVYKVLSKIEGTEKYRVKKIIFREFSIESEEIIRFMEDFQYPDIVEMPEEHFEELRTLVFNNMFYRREK